MNYRGWNVTVTKDSTGLSHVSISKDGKTFEHNRSYLFVKTAIEIAQKQIDEMYGEKEIEE